MKKKLFYNTVSSFAFQILTIICGFVLPRLFIGRYGSEINGLVSSITQFLSIISFLELGVGSVIQSSLYKPLADKNSDEISAIHNASNRFFRKIAYILLAYVIILTVVYPFIANQNFDWLFTALLILAISISSFAQYYFGITDSILLIADQRGYISYFSQILTLAANTVCCVLLIKSGASIHIVKLTTSVIYLARPLFVRAYVNSHYKINRKIRLLTDPLKQKWDAVTQHIAYIILNDTDTVVLTLMATLSDVSVYSVYYMVVNGIKTLFTSATNGFQSVLGEMLAKGQEKRLREFFSMMEYLLHTLIVLIFTVTAVLIVPFVSVYTKDVSDISYAKPLFAVLLVSAHAFHCLRTPYHIMIKAAGHFRQTSKCYIISAIMNIVISVAFVRFFGLVGVAAGTLAAMLYQTVWMAFYCSRNLIRASFSNFVKQCGFDLICTAAVVLCSSFFKIGTLSFSGWFVLAVKVFAVSLSVTVLLNFVFRRKKLNSVIKFFKEKQ